MFKIGVFFLKRRVFLKFPGGGVPGVFPCFLKGFILANYTLKVTYNNIGDGFIGQLVVFKALVVFTNLPVTTMGFFANILFWACRAAALISANDMNRSLYMVSWF